MTPGEELAALRLRAYGPNPDIHDDPAAWNRLLELQAPPSVAQSVTSRDATRDDEPGTVLELAGADSTSQRRWKGRAWVWAITLVITGAMGAGLGWHAARFDPSVVAVLSEANDLEVPGDFATFGPGELTRFENYLGVVIVTTHARRPESPQLENCIMVRMAGTFQGGCAAGEFDAQTDVAIGQASGRDWARIRDVHGDDAVLRFTHVGDHVIVRMAHPT